MFIHKVNHLYNINLLKRYLGSLKIGKKITLHLLQMEPSSSDKNF